MSIPSGITRSKLPRPFRPLIGLAFLVCIIPEAHGRQLKFHGPVLQWYEDPTTTVSFSWIEEIAPDVVANPVWRKGKSGFGYGDNDDVTVLGEPV